MSSHPLIQDGLEIGGRNAAIELSHMALHGAPYAFNVVTLSKVPFGVVVSISGVAKPLDIVVGHGCVSNEVASSRYPILEKEFNAVLVGIRDHSEAQPSGIGLYGTNHNSLSTMALLAKPGLVHRHHAREELPAVWWICSRKRAYHRWMVG